MCMLLGILEGLPWPQGLAAPEHANAKQVRFERARGNTLHKEYQQLLGHSGNLE